MRMKSLTLASALALCVAAPSAMALDLEVKNESKTKIMHLFMSAVDEQKWGEDQLGENDQDSIDPSDSYTIEEIEQGIYDLKIVAEDGSTCVLPHIRFAEGKVWTITEELLDACVKQK